MNDAEYRHTPDGSQPAVMPAVEAAKKAPKQILG